MKLDIDFTKIPKFLKVDVKKGQKGVLIVELPQFTIATEANDLNELFFNVNDLIYTYFDIPKKYQDKICFVPNVTAREQLVKIAQESAKSKFSQFKMQTFYTEDLFRSIIGA